MSANNLREVMAKPILDSSIIGERAKKSGSKNLGYFLAALGTMLFAMKAVFVKLAYLPIEGAAVQTGDPITLLLVRMGFSVPVYIVIAVILLRRRKAQGLALPPSGLFFKAILVGALSYYICSYLDFTGLQYITANLERMLLFTYPAFVILLGAMFFGTRLSFLGILSVIIAYSGIGLIFFTGDIATGTNVVLGSSLILTCALLFGLSQLLSKRVIEQLGGGLYTCAAMLSAGTFVILHFFTTKLASGDLMQALTISPQVIKVGAMIAIFSTLIPSFLVNFAIGRIGAQATAAMGMLSPIVTIIAAIVLLNEPFGVYDGLGTLVTIFGIGLYTLVDKRRAKTP